MLPLRFERNYAFLQNEIKKITISKEELSLLYSISKSTIDVRISQGINIPNHLKLGTAKNSLVRINIVDLACFMTGIELDDKVKSDLLYQYLFKKYKRVIIPRKTLCYELGISLGTLSSKMKKEPDRIPLFQKSKQKNAPIFFNIADISDFLTNTIKTF